MPNLNAGQLSPGAPVIPAKAGIQGSKWFLKHSFTDWTPAFAGETNHKCPALGLSWAIFLLAGNGVIPYNPPVSDCLFCKIARKEIPAQVVYDTGDVLAFNDIHPQAPVHVLIIPKKHVANVLDLSTEDVSLFGEIQRAAVALADHFSVRASGFRLVVNNGSDAGQAVAHLHCHFLAGRPLRWPPG